MINHQDIDDYAAEYVLGTLDRDERVEVSALRRANSLMDEAITAWENRLAPLLDRAPAVEPSPDVFIAIERRISTLMALPPVAPPVRSRINRGLVFALAASLAFVIVTGIKDMPHTLLRATSVPMAVLEKDKIPLFIIHLNEKNSTVSVQALSQAPQDKSYELWLIVDGEKAPRPLGIIDSAPSDLFAVNIDPRIARQATLAVSVEPLGGSKTGLPTGPVVVTGKFENVRYD